MRRSLIDEIEILSGLLMLLPVLTGLLMIAMYFANRMVSRKLWQPFYITLQRLREYGMEEKTGLGLPDSGVREFRELNQELGRLVERIQDDYYALKEYSENTTHEIQTPPAIIQSKPELLQDANLTIAVVLVNAANQAVSPAGAVKGNALLLLVRIKNYQYESNGSVQLTGLLRNRLAHFEELYTLRNLKVEPEAEEEVTIQLNPLLAEMLTDNLISNAIRHNLPGGTIHLSLTAPELAIRNPATFPVCIPKRFSTVLLSTRAEVIRYFKI